MNMQSAVNQIKSDIENSIKTGGVDGKNSLIRSQKLINLIHEAVKHELLAHNIIPANIFPPIGSTKPELKVAGFLKQKDQDISIVPSNVSKNPQTIDWGPLQAEHITDPLGKDFAEQTLVINVRSQLSSLAKNADTLFERTFAETFNLHLVYPKMVLGEVYMIPIFEYDDKAMRNNHIKFKTKRTNIEKYISFFNSLNGRNTTIDNHHMYERCALIIVDFRTTPCKIFSSTSELKAAGLISNDFGIELSNISFNEFVKDLKETYAHRFNINNILR